MTNRLKSNSMKSPSLKIFLLSVLIVITFIAIIAILSYKQSSTIKSTISLVQRTEDILYNSEKILSMIANYENTVLGSQANNAKISLQKRQSLKAEINNKLLELKKLTIDNNLQQQHLTALDKTLENKIHNTDAISIFKDENALTQSEVVILQNDSLYARDVKRLVMEVQGEEEKLLVISKANNDKALLTMRLILYVLGGVIIILLIAILMRMQRTIYEKQTTALLHEHATLIDLSTEAIITTDAHFNIVQWSKGAEKLYGYTKEVVLGKGVIQYVASKIDRNTRKNFIKDLQKNGTWQGEMVQFDKNGNEMNLVISYSQILNADGTIKGYTSTRSDITERKKLELALQQLNTNLELEITQKTAEIKEVFQRMQKAFLAFDANWNCTYANQSIMKYLNATHEHLIGCTLENLFQGIVETNFYKTCITAMQTQQTYDIQEYIPLFDCWFESSIYPSPQGVSIYIADISKEKKAQKELLEQKKQLRNLSNHIQDLREEERKIIARELHDDLGQMATVLKIDIRSLKNSLVNSSIQILEKVNHTLETVDTLIYKIRKISHELRPSLLDNLGLQSALKSHCLDFEKNTGISCFFYNETLDERLPQDFETALFRICQESLTNIMRHADASEVVVVLSKNDNDIALKITDNGKGFCITTKNNTLGLVGITERAASIKSNLTIESAIGAGTTITVRGVLHENELLNNNMYS